MLAQEDRTKRFQQSTFIPSGQTVSYVYDPLNRLSEVTQDTQTLATYSYDTASRLTRLERPVPGVVSAMDYDPAGQIIKLTHSKDQSSLLAAFTYTYDTVGNRMAMTEELGGASTTWGYTYDSLRRLIEATASGETNTTTQYLYDAVGNRINVVENGNSLGILQYNAANQVTNPGWDYDTSGNLLQDGTGNSYTYDSANRLTSMTPNGGATTNYAYNDDGVLVSETTNGVETRYTQDLASPLSQVLSDGTVDYMYGTTRLAQVQNNDLTYELHDALGSVRAAVDPQGNLLDTLSYDPWGVPLAGTNPEPFGFTGELQRGDLVHLRARWYHPESGRFLSKDPFAGFPKQPYSQHPYQYGYSNPVLFTDPTGKCALLDWHNTEACDEVWEELRQHGIESEDPINYYANWTLEELELVRDAVNDFKDAAGWNTAQFRRVMTKSDSKTIVLVYDSLHPAVWTRPAATGPALDMYLSAEAFVTSTFAKRTVVHELAHVWDIQSNYVLSNNMATRTNSSISGQAILGTDCLTCSMISERLCGYNPGTGLQEDVGEKPARPYGETDRFEDWATAVEGVVYDHSATLWNEFPGSDRTRRAYIQEQFDNS